MASVNVAADRLEQQLRAVYLSCGLRRNDIVTIQRSLVRMERSGLAPTANEFWAATARPRAGLLTDEATTTIERALRTLLQEPTAIRDRSEGKRTAPATSVAAAAAEALHAAIPGREAIDDLGRWWQRRLRRAATIKALSSLAGTAARDAELVVSRFEMGLLERTPWSHGDRLLSAFELAHVEIGHVAETQIARAVNELFSEAPDRTVRRDT